MTDKGDRKFAVYKTLDYLRKTPGKPRTSKQVLNYLQQETEWGRYREENVRDGGLRHVQLLLKDICESTEFNKIVECTEFHETLEHEEPDEADDSEENPPRLREKTYRFISGDSDKMEIEEACCIAMAEKFLDIAMPKDFYDASLSELYTRARKAIKENENRFKKTRAVKSFVERIEIAPRGQQLEKAGDNIPYAVLDTIYQAILDKRCIKLQYSGSPRVMHPYAVIIREPKFYLLGVEDAVMKKFNQGDIVPRLYLCNRITDAEVITGKRNRTPPEFSAREYVRSGQIDVGFTLSEHNPGRNFTLELLVYKSDNENDRLLQDLEEFPLSKRQTITKATGTDHYLLTARDMRATHQLVEWIIGRTDRIEVRKPEKLRNHIARIIAVMHQRYNGN